MSKRLLILPVLVFVLISCNSKGCYDDMTVKVYCHLYKGTSSRDSVLKNVSVWGIAPDGTALDSALYDRQSTASIALDLNPDTTTTRFLVLAVVNNRNYTDTITLTHVNQPWFQSMECGCMMFSTLTGCRTAGTLFKTATIEQPEVNNLETIHVRLNL